LDPAFIKQILRLSNVVNAAKIRGLCSLFFFFPESELPLRAFKK